MKGIFFLKNSYFLRFLLSILIFLCFGLSFQLRGACRGEGFMGISSKDPIMSWVDLTFSPVYTSASTSGTSGCKNWDFPYEKYMEYVINRFIKKSHKQLLVETVQGYGSHLEALSLITCPQLPTEKFAIILRTHSKETISAFSNSGKKSDLFNKFRDFIKNNPKLSYYCWLS